MIKRDPIQDLIDGAAISLIDETDPVVAANFVRSLGPSRHADAISKAQKAVITYSGGSNGSQQPPSNALRQAYLILGYALGDDAEFAEGDRMFQTAAEGGDPGQIARSWDGMAYGRIRAAENETNIRKLTSLLDDAAAKLKKAEEASPNYDSALFHEAEIAEIRAKNAITQFGCQARADLDQATEKFRVVTGLKPDFSIAYYKIGVMWLKFLNYLQNGENGQRKNCSDDLSKMMRDVAAISNDNLKMALRYDIYFADTWLQWSALAYQQAQIETDPTMKTSLFGLAIERNIRAVNFASLEFYPVRRLFGTIKTLSEWQEALKKSNSDNLADYADEYRLAGTRAFCLAFPGRSWTAKDREYLAKQKLCDTANNWHA